MMRTLHSHHGIEKRGTSHRSLITRRDSVKGAESFRELLAHLEAPFGLLTSVLACYKSCYCITWILDNSSSMKVKDSHVARSAMGISDHWGDTLHNQLNSFMHGTLHHKSKDGHIIKKRDNMTRWHELQDCIFFHSYMAAKCWIRTKLWLVNVDNDGGNKFSLCCGSPDDVPAEMSRLISALKHATLAQDQCPLSTQVHKITKIISELAPALNAHDQKVTVVICTQGFPMDEHGSSTRTIQQEFWSELKALSKLPVKLIIRLCTDNKDVIDFYNILDRRTESIDVLDDYWGEAMEVHLYNPWLTYGIGLHRLREAGLLPKIFDVLDERPLTLDQLHEFCRIFFIGDEGCIDLPHPRKSSWENFFQALKVLMDKEKSQWNPVKKKVMPWIDMEKLQAMHGSQKIHRRHSMESHGIYQCQSYESTKSYRPVSRKLNSQNNNFWHHSTETRESTKLDRPDSAPSNSQKSEPMNHWSHNHHQHPQESHGTNAGYYNRRHSTESSKRDHPETNSWKDKPRCNSMEPQGSYDGEPRRHSIEPQGSYDGYQQWHHSNEPAKYDPPKSPPSSSQNSETQHHQNNRPLPRQRSQRYRRANQNDLAKSKIHSASPSSPHVDLQNFILTAPLKFPPTNTMVEPHLYFEKWNAFDPAAFVGVIGDELTELLLRGIFF
ncbi:hypothetical protein ACHAXA_000086 [Cyclostephanos tholiformis]|uniref:Uncharacterized protein n=1 Tax=Cyclostephanos tholiformis TaxID=382380 RepID=A0ABD3RW38_9STRA